MKYLIGLLIGVALTLYWPRIRQWYLEADQWILRKAGRAPAPQPPPTPLVSIDAISPPEEKPASPPLADKLRALFERADVEINTSSTAKELESHPLLSSTVGSEAWNSRDLKSRPH